jgi:hypothetical protein
MLRRWIVLTLIACLFGQGWVYAGTRLLSSDAQTRHHERLHFEGVPHHHDAVADEAATGSAIEIAHGHTVAHHDSLHQDHSQDSKAHMAADACLSCPALPCSVPGVRAPAGKAAQAALPGLSQYSPPFLPGLDRPPKRSA